MCFNTFFIQIVDRKIIIQIYNEVNAIKIHFFVTNARFHNIYFKIFAVFYIRDDRQKKINICIALLNKIISLDFNIISCTETFNVLILLFNISGWQK